MNELMLFRIIIVYPGGGICATHEWGAGITIQQRSKRTKIGILNL
jgi:hypothetical protein